MPPPDVTAVLAAVARDSRARLVAYLAARCGDVAAAEDAVAEAFRAALVTWPDAGVPEKPEAWLFVTARRKLLDAVRHDAVHAAAADAIEAATSDAFAAAMRDGDFPDERLKLLFVCAHPALDPAVRTPLMLQTVLGLDANRIASAFLVKPAAMSQRLLRAKAKIRDARIPFEIPERSELPERLQAVLEAVYAMFTLAWDDVAGADTRSKELTVEAISLGRLVAQCLPDEPEPQALVALMLYCEARRPARVDADGNLVPLTRQDTTRWSMPLIHEAHHLLLRAQRAQRIGPYQLEAAIQSVHTRRAIFGGETDWEEIAVLYEGLVRLAPTTGARVARASAAAAARGPELGWSLLQEIPPQSVQTYQPYWALAGDLLQRLGRRAEAAAALERAIGLTENAAVRGFLVARRQTLLEAETRAATPPVPERT